MPDTAPAADNFDVVLVPPTRRDGAITARLLAQQGIAAVVEVDIAAVAQRVQCGTGALVLTDITLATAGLQPLTQALCNQPDWSNLPVLALCPSAGQPAVQAALLESWPNVTVLDRPTSTRALVSAIRASLRMRRAQYQLRDQITSLLQAQQALRDADRRKDEFLAILAHELRNPLAPIVTGIELLGRPSTPAAASAQVHGMVRRQLGLMVRLIDDLLDVSRIATGKIVLHPERLDLRLVCNMALESTAALLDSAGHRLHTRLPDTPVWVQGDASRLVQAVSNLLTNAIKYTPDGGRIVLELALQPGLAEISVADNGVGIPPPMLDKVFNLFAQVDATLARAQGGLGIGLSLVRSLALMHGGSVAVESAGHNQGSRFALRLPLAPAGAAQAPDGLPAAAGAAPAAAAAAAGAAGLRVLVIDDNADAADSLALLIAGFGHASQVAHDGSTGLQLVQSFRPALVFCDIGMPGLNGYQVAQQLAAHPQRAAITLVALTGWGADDDRQRAHAAGFDMHLVKPAPPEQVHAALLAAAGRPGWA